MIVPTNPLELARLIIDGKIDSHPGIRPLLRKAQHTNDWQPLIQFLNENPHLVGIAKRNIRLKEIQKDSNPFMPYPSVRDAEKQLSGPLKLGYVNQFNSWFGVFWDILTRLCFVIGRIGSGKTILAYRILYQALQEDLGFNILIPDQKQDYRHLTAMCPNLKVLPSHMIYMNPFEVPEWQDPRAHIAEMVRTWVAENYLVGTSENYLRRLLKKIFRARGIFDGSINYPTFRDIDAILEKTLQKPKTYRFADILLWIQNRINPYLDCKNFNCIKGIPFEVFQKENIVLELDSGGFTDRMANYTVAHISHQLYLFNKAKQLRGAKLRTLLFADESRKLMEANRDKSIFGESIISEDITKSREFGVSWFLLTQDTASLNETVRSLAFLKIAFPLNDAQDIDFIKESWGLSDEQRDHLFKLPQYGVAVVRYGAYEDPFLMGVPPFELQRYVTDEELEKSQGEFWSDIKKNIIKANEPLSIESRPEEIPPKAVALLFNLSKTPFVKVSEMTTRFSGFNSTQEIVRGLTWLTKHGFIERQEFQLNARGRKSAFAVLTPEAHKFLNSKGPKGKGASFGHALFQNMIHSFSKKQGEDSRIEGRMKGSRKAIDVLTADSNNRFTAYEITLHFDNMISNIWNDFNAGVDEIVIVTRDKNDQKRAIDIVSHQEELHPYLDRISFRTIQEFSE